MEISRFSESMEGSSVGADVEDKFIGCLLG